MLGGKSMWAPVTTSLWDHIVISHLIYHNYTWKLLPCFSPMHLPRKRFDFSAPIATKIINFPFSMIICFSLNFSTLFALFWEASGKLFLSRSHRSLSTHSPFQDELQSHQIHSHPTTTLNFPILECFPTPNRRRFSEAACWAGKKMWQESYHLLDGGYTQFFSSRKEKKNKSTSVQ